MTAEAIINSVLDKGIVLERVGDNLRVVGPAPMVRAVRDELRRHKAEILIALSQVWARKAAALLAQVHDDDFRADLRERFEERAGICEFDGGMIRDEAERAAFDEIRAVLLNNRPTGEPDPPR